MNANIQRFLGLFKWLLAYQDSEDPTDEEEGCWTEQQE